MSPATPIADEVAALAASRADQPAEGPSSVFAREQLALAEAPVPDSAITPGTHLRDVPLLDPHGASIGLYDALGERPAVLVFYRGAWCPYCNIALRVYQAELLPELVRRGVGLVAVSPQLPDGSLSMQEKNELAFTVLSDPGHRLARFVGIVTAPSAEAQAAQLELGLDLAAINADHMAEIPMPSTLIVDSNRVARWVDVHPDYTTRSEPAQILAALDASHSTKGIETNVFE